MVNLNAQRADFCDLSLGVSTNYERSLWAANVCKILMNIHLLSLFLQQINHGQAGDICNVIVLRFDDNASP